MVNPDKFLTYYWVHDNKDPKTYNHMISGKSWHFWENQGKIKENWRYFYFKKQVQHTWKRLECSRADWSESGEGDKIWKSVKGIVQGSWIRIFRDKNKKYNAKTRLSFEWGLVKNRFIIVPVLAAILICEQLRYTV